MQKLFTLIFLLIPFFMNSQNSYKLVKDDAVYREGVGYLINPPHQFGYEKKQFLMKGDTVMLGNTYKKLYETNYDSIISTKTYIGAIRQDSDSKVYFVKENSFYFHSMFHPDFTDSTEVMLYDFNIGIGDTVMVSNYMDSIKVVVDEDSVLINGEYRKRWQMRDKSSFPNYHWIEGIGSTKGLFSPALEEDENKFSLNCYEDLHVFWNNPEISSNCYTVGSVEAKRAVAVEIFPNPAISHITVKCEANSVAAMDIYNLAGQLILSKELDNNVSSISVSGWNPGLYFIRINTGNGIITKKVVVK